MGMSERCGYGVCPVSMAIIHTNDAQAYQWRVCGLGLPLDERLALAVSGLSVGMVWGIGRSGWPCAQGMQCPGHVKRHRVHQVLLHTLSTAASPAAFHYALPYQLNADAKCCCIGYGLSVARSQRQLSPPELALQSPQPPSLPQQRLQVKEPDDNPGKSIRESGRAHAS